MSLYSFLSGPLAARFSALSKLYPVAIELSLGRMYRLLEDIGNPHQKLPPVLHVAGTNGKGSTCAFLKSCLTASGYRVHVNTSPHLVRFNERICLNGDLISDSYLLELWDEMAQKNGDQATTPFEFTTALALLAFSRIPADFVILEVGMGGEFDATNVIDTPLVTGVSRISYDHQRFLGDDLKHIASAKAGIFKKSAPACIQHQPTLEAETTLLNLADQRAAKTLYGGRDWQVYEKGGQFYYNDKPYPLPALQGAHQLLNAGLALSMLDCLELPINFAQGLKNVQWPGRLQQLNIKDFIPNGTAELWLDGGHNDSGGEVLGRWAASHTKPLHLILAMLQTKDAGAFLTPLIPYLASLTIVPIVDEEQSADPAVLAEIATTLGLTPTLAPDWQTALANLAGVDKPVLISGSLYLAGSVLKGIEKPSLI